MSKLDVTKQFGKIGDRLAVDTFLGKVRNARARIEAIAAIHASGKNTDPETDPRDVAEALALYDHLLNNPEDWNPRVVRAHLGALPNSLAAKPVLYDRDLAAHLEINYFFKDYSDIVPAAVADKFKVVPVQVFRISAEDPWRDLIVTKIKHKEISVAGCEPKAGVYTKCVGITLAWGGTNEPCPFEDQPRIIDQPRHRCEHCSKEFSKARTKLRRTGRASNKAAKSMVDDLLSLLD